MPGLLEQRRRHPFADRRSALLLVPGADYASTIYELGSDQNARAVFGINGWSFRLFQVR